MAVALTDADVAGMLEVLHEAAAVDGPDAFTEPVIDALTRLLPVDGGHCCNLFVHPDPRVPADQLRTVDFRFIGAEWIRPGPVFWIQEHTEAFRLYGREEELCQPTPELVLRAVRENDLLSYRELRKRKTYWLIDRHFGTDSLALWLPAPEKGGLRRYNFTTLEGRIPDRYVQILQLLAPHFHRLYQRAAARRASSETRSPLTPREREILTLVAAGKANKEIARELWLSPHTVRSHLEHVFEKLEVRSRSAAVARAFGDPAAARRLG